MALAFWQELVGSFGGRVAVGELQNEESKDHGCYPNISC